MKKTLVLVLIVLMTSALFADVTVGSWGRVIPYVDSTDGGDPMFGTAPGWSNNGRLSIRMSASSDNNGMVCWMDTNVGDGQANMGENVYVWAKPADMVKLMAGKIQWDTFRGQFGGGSAAFIGESAGGEDDIFQRLYPQRGIVLELTPVEGFTAAAAIDGGGVLVEDAIEAGQYAAGYAIEGVGLFRAQYVGSNGTGEYMQAAFMYNGMEGLKVDAGAKFFLDSDNTANTADVALGASYSTGAIGVTTRVKADIGEDAAGDAEALVDVYGMFTYSLTDAPISSVFAEVGYDMTADGNNDAVTFQITARKDMAAGYLSAGFGYKATTGNDTVDDQWRIPVVLEYWF
ncbi:MAG: hypothetical protein JXB03_06475 [Spirochaetales bacterium]|nr:hypothetical protein [Spirochaetales bacterium]